MVTLIVGKSNGEKSKATIATYCDGADDPKCIDLDLECLEPGVPK